MNPSRPSTASRLAVCAAATAAAMLVAWLVLPGLRLHSIAMVRNLVFVAGLPATEREKYAAPGVGDFVLPPRVQVGLHLATDHKLPDFRLTAPWNADPLISQRMTEAAWPILRSERSRNVIGRLEEMPSECTVVDGYSVAVEPGYAVAYARCP